MIRAIVGLGNPGSQYTETRHNSGFRFVDALASSLDLTLTSDRKLSGSLASWHRGVDKLFLFKPSTFMNHSGRAVSALAQYYRLDPKQILVVYDELDLAPGVARLKLSGGTGGHNGLKDIHSALDSRDYLRLRLGIGRPSGRGSVVNYVLGRPDKGEAERIHAAILKSLDVLNLCLDGEMERAMTQLHTSDDDTQ